jgi:signal transduction histidine kinase
VTKALTSGRGQRLNDLIVDGLAVGALDEAVARTLARARLCAVAFEVLVIASRPRWYLTPAHLVVPVAAAVWGLAAAAILVKRGLSRALAAADGMAGLLLAASVTVATRPDTLGGGPNWVLLRLIGSAMTVVAAAPAAVWLPVTVVMAGTAAAATRLLGGVSLARLVLPYTLVIVVVVLFGIAGRSLRAGAASADELLARGGARRRVRAVTDARARDLREAERIVHDTVLNTLTGLAWDGLDAGEDIARSRCRHAVAVCEELLADTGGADDARDGLVARIGRVIDEARAAGLAVEASFECGCEVPSEVAAALSGAAREALSNVRRHAGVWRARVDVRVGPDGARVAIGDRGVGFSARTVRSGRLGIRRSILDRMADVGGSAEIRSSPGRATTVTLTWSNRPVPGPDPDEAGWLERSYTRDAVRAVGAVALLWAVASGAILAVRLDHFRWPVLAPVAWAVSTGVLGWCVVAALRDRLRPPVVALLVAAALATQVAAAVSGQGGDRIPLNWAGMAGYGMVAFVTAARPVREWVAAGALSALTTAVVILCGHGPRPDTVAYVAIFVYVQAVAQSVVATLGPARRATARATARAARTEAELAAEFLAAVQVRGDRRARLADLRAEALPLLADIGAGRLDPSSESVRARCGAVGETVRRTLTHPAGSAGVMRMLEPAVRAAELRGATVATQATGALDDLPAPVADEVVRALSHVLATIAAGRVLITLIGAPDTGSAFVVSDHPATPAPFPPFPTPRWTDLLAETTDTQSCTEIRWHLPAPPLTPAHP